MSPRTPPKTADCTPADARARLVKAESFLAGAELVLETDADPDLDLPAVAAALCVLAGIAAADAACCIALGQRARGQNHHESLALVKTVEPHGLQLAKDLKRLLDRKDNAHYGAISITANAVEDMISWARRMTSNATDVLAR